MTVVELLGNFGLPETIYKKGYTVVVYPRIYKKTPKLTSVDKSLEPYLYTWDISKLSDDDKKIIQEIRAITNITPSRDIVGGYEPDKNAPFAKLSTDVPSIEQLFRNIVLPSVKPIPRNASL